LAQRLRVIFLDFTNFGWNYFHEKTPPPSPRLFTEIVNADNFHPRDYSHAEVSFLIRGMMIVHARIAPLFFGEISRPLE
jgi:hypothetical protein